MMDVCTSALTYWSLPGPPDPQQHQQQKGQAGREKEVHALAPHWPVIPSVQFGQSGRSLQQPLARLLIQQQGEHQDADPEIFFVNYDFRWRKRDVQTNFGRVMLF